MTGARSIILLRDGEVTCVLNLKDYDVIDRDNDELVFRLRFSDGHEDVYCQHHLPVEDGFSIESEWERADGGDICCVCTDEWA